MRKTRRATAVMFEMVGRASSLAGANSILQLLPMFDDTIAAIATPLGEGGLAVVRISGPEALAVADKIFLPGGKSSLKPSIAPTHTVHYGKVIRRGETVDEVLAALLRAPRTFTREDTVEISCHGRLLPVKLVLDPNLANLPRLAEPGAF